MSALLIAATVLWFAAAVWLAMQVAGLGMYAWRLAFNRGAISSRMRDRFLKLGPVAMAFEILASVSVLAGILLATWDREMRVHAIWLVPAYVYLAMWCIVKAAEALGRRLVPPQPAVVAAAPAVAAAPRPVAPTPPPRPVAPAAPPPPPARPPAPKNVERVQGTLLCDAGSIVMRDGMYRSAIGWSGRPDGPLPPHTGCVLVDVVVATQGTDPNPRVSAIRVYGVDANFGRTTPAPPLSARHKELVRQYIDAEIPPYMLKMGGQAVVDAALGAAVPSKRPRKRGRPQNPDEEPVRFTCSKCGTAVPNAVTGGLVLRRTAGYWCRDCGVMLCRECQKTAVKEKAAAAGLAGTFVEHLGKAYEYEDWYGEECQFCASSFEMERVSAG